MQCLYRLDLADRTPPPSASILAGFETTNGSWGASAVQGPHLAHDRVRVLAAVAYGDVTYPFYGVGQSAGDQGVSIDLDQSGWVGLFEGVFRVVPHWYVGARYHLLEMTVATPEIPLPDGEAF